MCCGTKRLVEIQCPADCVYLASAREHPAAATIRRQQHDLSMLLQFMRDLKPEIRSQIAEKKELTPELKTALTGAINQFKATFSKAK